MVIEAKNTQAFVGTVIPVGIKTARWMFVTKAGDDTVRGHMWSANSQQWTKTACGQYAREACFRRTPRCPRPNKPAMYV